MAGILTKGITLGYSATEGGSYTVLTNLQEIPEIGNGVREKVETTTLMDDNKQYIAGLGDSGQDLSFKFLYEKAQFETLLAMDETNYWQVSMPDGITATFAGTPSVKFDSASPNNALTYTLAIVVESSIVFA